MTNNPLIIIAGPTASGKTDLAINLALRLNTEIISADSRLVYKDFNIGTAKPGADELSLIKHHLIDIVEPTFNYTAAIYKEDSNKIIEKLHQSDKIPIMAGGTGFYIQAAIDGLSIPQVEPDENYRNELKLIASNQGNQILHNKLTQIDPITASKLHYNDIFRIIRALEVIKSTGKKMSDLQIKMPSKFKVMFICLSSEDRDILYKRINQRVLSMIETGLVDEVKFLIGKYGKTLSLLKTLGYKEVLDFLEHNCSYTEMIENIQKNTRHYARRQLVWFRRDDRIKWYFIDKMSQEDILKDIWANIRNL